MILKSDVNYFLPFKIIQKTRNSERRELKIINQKTISQVEKKKRTIVFVDDDKVQHMINKRILKKLNLEVEPFFFDKPYQAIEWLSMNHADVVLLDINMPEMDGWKFLNHLEKKGIHVNIKMVTASVDPVDLRRSKEYNQISGFLIKPLKEDTYLEFLGD